MFAKETWVFLNTFADWFAALGSILAVIVALYLASLWIDSFVSSCVRELAARRLRSLRLRVYTSVGRVFEKRVEPGLHRRLLQHVARESAP